MKQFRIDEDHMISEREADGAPGASSLDLLNIGTPVTVYDIPDGDRGESFVVFNSGRVIQISCDPSRDYHDVDGHPLWFVCYYDCSELPVAEKLCKLEWGHWYP
jgi:hypothetical protein